MCGTTKLLSPNGGWRGVTAFSVLERRANLPPLPPRYLAFRRSVNPFTLSVVLLTHLVCQKKNSTLPCFGPGRRGEEEVGVVTIS